MNKFILSMDIGGTTFTSSVFDDNLQQLTISDEFLIKDNNNKTELIASFVKQIKTILVEQNIDMNEVQGLSISCPGPLDSKKGLILETPNLTMLQNTNLSDLIKKELHIPVQIENDANLFALGEWYRHYKTEDVFVGITLGSGLGVGIVINGKIFVGAHGMGAEYGISQVEWGAWEDEISIDGIETLSTKLYSGIKSPQELFNLANNNDELAIKIWNLFGQKLGLFISHIINLLDPSVITIGGGISKAFSCFNNSMVEIIQKHSPSFTYNLIDIHKSDDSLQSIHLGAAIALKN